MAFSELETEYLREVLGMWGRQRLVEELENIGCACYDDEPNEDLIEAIIHSIECNDIDFDWSYSYANTMPHYIKMLRLEF